MAGEQQTLSLPNPLTEHGGQLVPAHRIEPVERLIENQNVGIVRECLSQLRPLSHPARVARNRPVHRLSHSHQFESLLRRLDRLLSRHPLKLLQVPHPIEGRNAGVQPLTAGAVTEPAK